MRSFVVNLRRRSALDPRRCGGKGAGLARLMARGFDVPPGFVLTTEAFAETVHPGHPADDSPLGHLPAGIHRHLLAAGRHLGGPFAVRSSLVGEDGPCASMAGQLTTVLDVAGAEELEAAVLRCYASALGPRLSVYRRNLLDQSEEDAASTQLAVVVQRMQPSKVAGVAFSADPLTGQLCVVIEAADGPPDAVVSGRTEPDCWRVDARGILVESPLTAGSPGLLDKDRILELAALVRRIAEGAPHPVDVEWCWDGERFWFLQARPISSLVGHHIYSNRLVSDMSPGLIKPLMWSTNTLGMARNVIGPVFDSLLGPTGLDYDLLVRRIHSRLYADMTILGDLFTRLGMPANSFEIMARDETGHRPALRPSPRRLIRMRRAIPFLWRNGRVAKEVRSFIQCQNEALDRFRSQEWKETSAADLLSEASRIRKLHGRSQWYIFLVALNSMIRKRILDRMVRRHVPDLDSADLIRGLAGLKALEPNRRLQELAELAARLPEEQRASLSSESGERIEQILADGREGRRLLHGFAAFHKDFGFLSANGTDISGASWAEKPETIWRMVARLQGTRGLYPAREAALIRRRTRRRAREALHPAQRGFFSRLLKSTVVYINLRERVSLLLSEGAYEMRRVFLALGRRLVAEADLHDPEDIFFLYLDELEQLVAGDLLPDAAVELVARRRREMESDEHVHPPDTICGDLETSGLGMYEIQDETLVGIGGSSGVVEGRARIVLDPLDAPGDLDDGDILVVPFTDVGWSPLFAGIGGIIAESGGQLSHTAIVAREYNLPAVVGVPGVTRRLREFQPITIDGHAGRVYLGHLSEREERRA